MDLRFRLLNVFALEGDPFSGNPLAVVTDAAGLDAGAMQRLARQFNLSESTFVTDVGGGPEDASVRIFTPDYEMPFAGHPTLGTAAVVAGLHGGADAVALSMPAGRIPVVRDGAEWTLTANEPVVRPCPATPEELATVLGLPVDALTVGGSAWVDAGVEQLIVEVRDVEALRACVPDTRALVAHATPPGGNPHLYAWTRTGEDEIEARLFFIQRGAVAEDPATGSACANLGGWLRSLGERGRRYAVSQGAAVGRPSRLVLTIDEEGAVHVGGRVNEIGAGQLSLPD
jgi:PhzF family phenazine biosynthesis protein